MTSIATSTQIPLSIDVIGSNGKLSEPWAYFFEHIQTSLPAFGVSYALDVTAETYAPLRIAQGPNITKGSNPIRGTVFVSTDTGEIYIETAGNWVLQSGSLTGDISKPFGTGVTTLASVNFTPGTFGSADTIPVLEITEKGLVISSSSVPVGNAETATALETPRTINGVNFDGTGNISFPADASTLTGATLASNVLTSSLTTVGTLAGLTVTAPITGSITGSAGSVDASALTGDTLASGIQGFDATKISIGTTQTSATVGLDVRGSLWVSTSSSGSAPANGGRLAVNDGGLFVESTGTSPIEFYTSNTERMQIDSSGNVISNINGTAPTLGTNSQMVFSLTSNTNLRISVRGTDGVTRIVNLTLA